MKANKKKDTILKNVKKRIVTDILVVKNFQKCLMLAVLQYGKTLTIYEKWVTRLTQLQTEATNLCHHRVF